MCSGHLSTQSQLRKTHRSGSWRPRVRNTDMVLRLEFASISATLWFLSMITRQQVFSAFMVVNQTTPQIMNHPGFLSLRWERREGLRGKRPLCWRYNEGRVDQPVFARQRRRPHPPRSGWSHNLASPCLHPWICQRPSEHTLSSP